MRITVLLLLLGSVLGRLAHRDCVSEPQTAAAHEQGHTGHVPVQQHQHEAPTECTMVGSCATIAAPANLQIFDMPIAFDRQGFIRLQHDYRDPQLARLEPPPRNYA